ncbi:protein-glutamine gamma-glutamyltransferase [Streptomyces sp. NPDC096030]|uniref:protein-glutamine gamma-glutamyltransferase n=1 Tax=Streptomyces sp. NPDC096030 TaxID=3155423 RepID=UPI00331C6F2F
MNRRRGLLAIATVSAVMCTAGFMPSVSQAAGPGTGETELSYAEKHSLTAAEVSYINALNKEALALGRPGSPAAAQPGASASPGALVPADDDMVTPDAEPLSRMPDPYFASGGRAATGVSNYIRKWQQVYSLRGGTRQQMTESQREQLAYGCVGVTWVNSGPYPTNKLAFSYFDEDKYTELKSEGPGPGETQAEFEGRIAKESFDEEAGLDRAREVADVMNKALENSHSELEYITRLKAELAENDDALLGEDASSNFYSALRNTPSFRAADGGSYDPSKMKAVIYSKHFWSGQSGTADERKYGDPDAFRPDGETGLVDMSRDRNVSRSPAAEGESWINFDYGWLGDQAETSNDETVWTHANHYHAPNGSMGAMQVYESKFQNWSSGYADFDRGTYAITFIPRNWNTAPAKVTQGWPRQ